MRPTLQQIIDKFHHFNHLIFEDKLPLPEIRQTTDIYRAGCTICNVVRYPDGRITRSGWVIRISVRFDRSESHYDNVLVHEMIHYYIGYNNLKDNDSHGDLFVRMMNEINEKFGMGIQVRGVFSDEDISQLRPRQRFFCIVRMEDGQIAFQVIAKNKVLEVWDFYKTVPDIQEITWYTSLNPRLGFAPLTTGPHLFFIDEASLPELLEGAVPLSR